MAGLTGIGRRLYTDKKKLLPVLIFGFLTGILVVNMGKGILLEETGLFDEYVLCRMKYMSVDRDALFFYLLGKRMLPFLCVAVLATTYLGMAVCFGCVVWYGVASGMYLTALTLRFGIKGWCLAVTGIFPQFLFYIPAFLLLLHWSEDVYRIIYFQSVNNDDRRKNILPWKILWLFFIGILNLIGCLLEGYVNPGLLTGYLKVF